jgi:hypothetical protein
MKDIRKSVFALKSSPVLSKDTSELHAVIKSLKWVLQDTARRPATTPCRRLLLSGPGSSFMESPCGGIAKHGQAMAMLEMLGWVRTHVVVPVKVPASAAAASAAARHVVPVGVEAGKAAVAAAAPSQAALTLPKGFNPSAISLSQCIDVLNE